MGQTIVELLARLTGLPLTRERSREVAKLRFERRLAEVLRKLNQEVR